MTKPKTTKPTPAIDKRISDQLDALSDRISKLGEAFEDVRFRHATSIQQAWAKLRRLDPKNGSDNVEPDNNLRTW